MIPGTSGLPTSLWSFEIARALVMAPGSHFGAHERLGIASVDLPGVSHASLIWLPSMSKRLEQCMSPALHLAGLSVGSAATGLYLR